MSEEIKCGFTAAVMGEIIVGKRFPLMSERIKQLTKERDERQALLEEVFAADCCGCACANTCRNSCELILARDNIMADINGVGRRPDCPFLPFEVKK